MAEPTLGWSIAAAFEKDAQTWALEKASIVEPMLFAIQVGIMAYCGERGLRFDGTVGHSIGEVTAVWAAGGLSLEEAVRIVIARSQTEECAYGMGSMAAVSYDPHALESLLPEYPSLQIACFNSSDSFTLAGEVREIEALCKRLSPNTFLALPLGISYPYHSVGMEGLKETLFDKLGSVRAEPMTRSFYSCVSGSSWLDRRTDAEYWWRNLREPVQFAGAVKAMLADGYRHFVEVTPFSILNWYIDDMAREKHLEIKTFSTLEKEEGLSEFERRIAEILLELFFVR